MVDHVNVTNFNRTTAQLGEKIPLSEKLIDPVKVTNFNRTTEELELFLAFCLAVAGKNATRTAINLQNLLNHAQMTYWGVPVHKTPFELIRTVATYESLSARMKALGFGCYNIKGKGLTQLAWSGLNLHFCTVEDLENLYGIGMKSARYFVLHSRANARVACLDTHVLKWLSYYTGYDVPKSDPSRKKYLELEKLFLNIADLMKTTPAKLDLAIWNKQRGSDAKSLAGRKNGKNTKVLDG